MQKYGKFFIILILVTCLSFIMQPWAHFPEQIIGEKAQILLEKVMAQEISDSDEKNGTNVQEQVTPDNDKLGAPVVVDGQTLFYLKTNMGDFSPRQRAEIVVRRITAIAEDHSQSVDLIEVEKLSEDVFLISSDKRPILLITKADAKEANQPLNELSREYTNKIKASIAKYRQQRSVIHTLRSAIYTILSIAAFILVMRIIKWLHQINERFLTHWLHQRLRPKHQRDSNVWQWLEVIGWDFYRFFYLIHKLVYWTVILSIIYLFIPLILSFFPLTQKLSNTIIEGLTQIVINGWNNFLDYLPNLLIITINIAVVYYLNKYCQRFFLAIENETISLPGFYTDWAKPTYRLSIFFIIAFALALIYPFLPGASSASFQGISIFIGALVTIGGAGALGNIVGGLIIIYTRAYQIGDRIKIDDIKGDVLEKTILSTRICTLDNEVVTIPNATIINSNIINYSAARRDFERPLLLKTTITLGYDVPWRKVYQALVSAANVTSNILKDPAPFVVQTSLDDFYVSYQLKAYTDQPTGMVKIYSELHENIQDKCNEVGIEIMSPHYSALRDGNQNTIPEDYLSNDYPAPGVEVNPVGKIFNQPFNPDNERE